MAHLWIGDERESDALAASGVEWSARPLDADVQVAPSARLMRATTPDGERWVLIGAPSVRVNGIALAAGIAVLRDRDEICTSGHRIYFSTESLATVAPHPGGARPTFCPRCTLEIVAGSTAVACPQCRIWHHQSDELPCWTHTPRCASCNHTTALDAGFRWTPEDL